MEAIGIVGWSERAEALSAVAQARGTRVVLWDDSPPVAPPEGVTLATMREVAEASSLLFFCAPMGGARGAARRLGEHVTGQHVLVHTSRELEPETRQSLSVILREETATHRIGFLTGPWRQAELRSGMRGAGSLFSRFGEVQSLVEEALVSERFRLYRGKDLTGAEIAAAYTRVIAFVCGVGLGMEQGASVGATLFARGLAEIGRVVVASGGAERTVFGMAGAGNLFADVQPPYSVEVELGRASVEFGRYNVVELGERLGESAGAFSELVQAVTQTCASLRVRSNICEAALAMITGELSTAQAAHRLMTLPVLDD